MPLYEYKCGSCGEVFEVLQKFSDEPLALHAVCGGPVERLISTSALQFKGTGWYVTDYARKSNGKAGHSAGSGDSKPSSETKPAAKTETASSEAKPAASSKPDTKAG